MEEASVHNTPPVLHLIEQRAAGIQGPVAQLSKAPSTAAVSVIRARALPLWADDDARFTKQLECAAAAEAAVLR